MKVNNILSLNCNDAMDFFMKSEQYHTFELPEYINFDVLLSSIKQAIGDRSYEECLHKGATPDEFVNVNLDILLNKDGRYAVRPIMLANPYLYYFLVREVCTKENWKTILDCFKRFNVPNITSCALPIVPEKVESFHNSTAILNWWNTIEQRSLGLSLEYRYMFVTDITNCYGSLNPQSFNWAFSMKGTEYEKADNCILSQNIQKYIRAFQQGRNIGIPQGSVIFDFIGEIVLGYSDLLLHERLKRNSKVSKPYEILRFRDDYRVFCNDKDTLEEISYTLQSVLESLNFRMNSQKTRISDSVITDSIKPDKLFYIYNTPVSNKDGVDFDGIEKHLLFALMLGRQFPNAGQLKIQLSNIDKRVQEMLKPHKIQYKSRTINLSDETNEQTAHDGPEVKEKVVPGSIRENVRVLVAIATQIAIENVAVTHYSLRLISRMVNSLKDETEKWDIIDKVFSKLSNMPNSQYNQLWLQNITYQRDKKSHKNPYDMRLCCLVYGDKDVELWNNNWLDDEVKKVVCSRAIVDNDKVEACTPVITFRETRAYNEQMSE